MGRTAENDLVNLALRVLAAAENPEIGMCTRDLASQLRREIPATSEDQEILAGRKDDRLSQVIRNLVSHRTLERRGLAVYYKDDRTDRGYYKLTPMGLQTISEETG